MKNLSKLFLMGFLLVLFLSVVSSLPRAQFQVPKEFSDCFNRCNKKYLINVLNNPDIDKLIQCDNNCGYKCNVIFPATATTIPIYLLTLSLQIRFLATFSDNFA
ncbi:UNVERIFIED_CONTAM: hypothetical protein RMT77_014348 [Armadillidium vulgare]